MIRFCPTMDPIDKLKIGKEYILAEDLFYCTIDDVRDLEIKDYQKIMELKPWGDLYIPEGTKMTFLGNKYSTWPTFKIGDEELDFANDTDICLVEVR